MNIIFNNVSFGFNEIFLNSINCTFSRGWTCIIGPNGTGKTTLLLLAAGKLKPVKGTILGNENTYYCPQRTDNPPDIFDDFLYSDDGYASRLKGIFKIEYNWNNEWNNLSHGERKRCQIASALWLDSQSLIIDEPTNHLDINTKNMIKNALLRYKGTGLIVSHDREILKDLPYQCLFLKSNEAVMRPGNYFDAAVQEKNEETFALNQKAKFKKKLNKLNKTANINKNKASNADKMKSKKNINKKDHDAKSKIDLARLSGKDGMYGKQLNQLQGRIKHEKEKYDSINIKKNKSLKYILPAEKLKTKFIFDIDENTIQLGSKKLSFKKLTIRPGERIALTGPNGSGKTTLIKFIIPYIKNKNILYMPQEITMEESAEYKNEILNLKDEEKGKIFSIIGSLGSDPKKLIVSSSPSPGEIRKLMLAKGIFKNPGIIIMDEPTNHMDLPSIECLENTLKECPASLLLISHDINFLKSLAEKEWNIQPDDEHENNLIVVQRFLE